MMKFILFAQLDLFTTLKALGILGVLLVFLGHRTLSHLASTSAKLKSAWDCVFLISLEERTFRKLYFQRLVLGSLSYLYGSIQVLYTAQQFG